MRMFTLPLLCLCWTSIPLFPVCRQVNFNAKKQETGLAVKIKAFGCFLILCLKVLTHVDIMDNIFAEDDESLILEV